MKRSKIYPGYFILPALLLIALLYLLPALLGTAYSFTDWNRYSNELHFVGWKNYIKVFSGGEKYIGYIKNTVFFTVLSAVLKLGLGLALAILFTSSRIRLRNLHRTIAFAPQVFSVLIIGITFKAMLHPSTGFINTLLRSCGLSFLAHDWLGSIDTAFGSIIAVDVWRGAGYAMVIFIAGIQNIPLIYYESASIDGAGFWAKLLHITIPSLIPTLTVNLVLSITYGLRVFDIVYVLTNGGPGNATDVINTATFMNFSKGNYAMGTTLSSILACATVIIALFIVRFMGKKEDNQ